MSNDVGDIPLYKASAEGRDEVVELLLTHGANPFLHASVVRGRYIRLGNLHAR